MSADGYDARADFLIEAREILDRLGEQVVALEQDPGDRPTLDAVFRGFHTIKGGAGFLDLPPMVALCHAFEDRIDAARSGTRELDAAAFDGAQRAVDLLLDMLDALGRGEDLGEVDAALLRQVRGGDAPAAAPAPAALDLPDNLDDLDFDALLDSLHGEGAIPGAAPAPAPVAAPPPPRPAAPAKPAAAEKPAPAATETEQTVRVDVRRLDALVNLVGELVLARNRLKTLRPGVHDENLDRAVTALDTVTARLQGAVMSARMQPVSRVFTRFPKLARDVARQLKKQVELVVEGGETELDRNLVEALADPLVHLVRNAIDHGIEMPDARRAAGKPEQGTVRLTAQQEGDHVAIEVSDDGGGIDPEAIRRSAIRKGLIDTEAAARLGEDECLSLLFLPGFSTRTEVSDLSGRGVGMDVVQSKIRELSGQVQIQSDLGKGSRFIIRVPLTLAILPTLLVELDDDVYALPLVRVIEVVTHDDSEVLWMDGQKILDLRERPLPVLSLREWLGLGDGRTTEATRGVVLQAGEQRFCLLVDRVVGREEVVIKALPRSLRGLPGYAGASLVGDGRMALILDVDALLESAQRGSSANARSR
ncbi:chemotaxis protein CheA [Thermomonas brevis]|uniref:Chemotaxis protein CheA n=1 Tax=Thermomonas brevis TaxID=215691 RepID=A0A7G9QTK6_9GAMM|nr:chemotaxis protein CheA [Thermomonas brevis]QNN46681.1 chemotaxis protein CheA [Thermomonas brevis]